MLFKETLKTHYAEYASQPDEWVANMEVTKRSIVEQVFKLMNFKTSQNPVRVVVLGASDKRYLPIHKRIFENLLQREIDMMTFDIEIDHLGGESDNVILHDATKPFPDAPYDIVFSHELMKFLTPEEQLKTIINSYQALDKNGLAMHILHEPSIKETKELRPWQYRVEPDYLIEQLQKQTIPAQKLVFNSQSSIDWLKETTVIVIKK